MKLFNSGQDVIIFFDRQGNLLDFWSPGKHGQPEDSKGLYGKSLRDLFPLEIAKLHFSHLTNVIETGVNEIYCYELDSVSGKTIEWEVQMIAIPGDQQRICCILKNTTEKQKIIKAVEQKQQQVQNMMKFTLEREDRMFQLKQEINSLRKSLGKQPKYMSYIFDTGSAKDKTDLG
ncbi:MAG: hypothetical protein ACE5D2_05795 [Fidelibacterota bacterium]